MRRACVPFVVTLLTASAAADWTIVETFAIPESASGLAWDGTWLYTGIYGVDGGRVYRIDPTDGTATLLFTGPQEDAFGLTFDGTHLWTTDHPGSSSTPAVAMQLDFSGNLVSQFDLPAHYMSGIAYDGGDFWVARYFEDPSRIFRVDDAGAVLDEFQAPDNQPWDLCIENGFLWMADYWGDALYKIDPATGAMLESHPSEGVDPAGIVYDGRYLWYCDNGEGGNDFLYKVDLDGGGTPQIDIPAGTFNYGLIEIGDVSTYQLLVRNTGDGLLTLDGVTFDPAQDLSCPAKFPIDIPAADSVQIPLEFAPTVFGPLDATAIVHSNDPVHPQDTIALTGHAVYADPTIDVSSSAHDYGAVRAGAHTRWFLRIENRGNQLLTIDDLAVNSARFYVDAAAAPPIDLAPLETLDVGVWFNPIADAAYAATLDVHSNDPAQDPASVSLEGAGDAGPRPIGAVLWSYTIDNGFDNTPKAMASIPDISGDGVADVIVCSEDNFIRCFNGNASGTGDVLWEHEIFSGNVYQRKGLQVTPDIDGDDHADVVVGATGGARLVRAISGATGAEIWSHHTDEYGDGGWVYQVDVRYDYDGDGTLDALAATGDDGLGTGPRRVYCLDGLTGLSIWERALNGPVFAVIGVEDFTGDGLPDVIAGASNASETEGRAYGIDGVNGTVKWTFVVAGSSVWGLAPITDITSDGIPDVMVGDFSGAVNGVDAATGAGQYVVGGFGLLTDLVPLDDVDGDGVPEVVPQHLAPAARAIGGEGTTTWAQALVDKAASVARIPDISGDGINDVVVGTLFSNNRAYFLDGSDGSVMHSLPYPSAVDGIATIPDIARDGSWEMLVGGRQGELTCYSGGLAVKTDPADVDGDGDVDFQDLLLVLAAWGPNPGHPADINGDGVVDFQDIVLLLAAWT